MIYIYIWSIENSILYLLFQFYFHFYIFLPRVLSIVTYFLPCFYEKRNWYTYYEQISTLRKFHVQINVYFQHLIQLSFQFSLLLFLFLLVTHLLSIYTSYYGYEKNNKYLSIQESDSYAYYRKSTMQEINTRASRKYQHPPTIRFFPTSLFWEKERESVVTRWHSRLILGKLRPSHYINRLNCRLCKECDWISAHNAHTGIDVSIETLTCKLPRDPIVVFSSK